MFAKTAASNRGFGSANIYFDLDQGVKEMVELYINPLQESTMEKVSVSTSLNNKLTDSILFRTNREAQWNSGLTI